MGADLYIQSLFQPNSQRWEKELEAAEKFCASLPEGRAEWQKAQERIFECWHELYSQGYFRDSYNDLCLLWKFGLSWWNDVIPMLDDGYLMSVIAAERLLAMLSEREEAFEERLESLSDEEQQDFRTRYIELRQFLNQAIAMEEPIDCSL